MKAIIEDGCTACGLCADLCPKVFEMQDVAVVISDADVDANIELAKEAADSCPVGIIKIE